MNVYAFYEPINEPWVNQDDQQKLIELWKKSWSYYGWNPIIYSIKECEQCEGYDEFYEKCKSYPTINPKKYEMFCFLRWIYMAKVGGWYADIDMINYGFIPKLYSENVVSSSRTLNCSAIYMNRENYRNIVNIMKMLVVSENDYYDYNNNGVKIPHLSDTYVLAKYSNIIEFGLDIFQEYPHSKYKDSLIVHYPFNMYSHKECIGKTRESIILEDKRTLKFI